MKKRLFYSFGLSALLLPILLTGCGGITSNSTSSSEVSSISEEITNPNLQYFGFYHPDGFVTEPAMLEEIDALDFTNFYLLNGNASGDVLNDRLAFIQSKGAKATVNWPGIWNIDPAQSYGIGKVHTLKTDWQQIFTNYINTIKTYVDDGTVYAFYTDEPAWNGIRETEFVTVTKWLSEQYPDTGRMACFAVAEVGISASDKLDELPSTYFDYLTDVSYDSYANWNASTRKNWLDKLKTKATKNQWIWATPRTFEDNPERTSSIIDSLEGFFVEAQNEPRYRGFSCFSWSNGFDGDWGYGAKSFVLEDSEYYSREIHTTMSKIGRTILGKELVDWTKVPVLSLVAPREVYNLGETVPFPMCGAVDGEGNDLDISIKLTSPTGVELDISEGEFEATESGDYEFTVSAGEGDYKKTKSCSISVRYEKEISVFENESYILDAGGDSSSYWCWPRQVVTDFSHSGKGSLKVTPHTTDGTWPRIIFSRDGNNLWDVSTSQYISMWVYNPSETAIQGFGFIFEDEFQNASTDVFHIQDLPAKQWTNVVANVDAIAAPGKIDLTRVVIYFGNCASGYQNRTPFYIDDVMMVGERSNRNPDEQDVIFGFENVDEFDNMPTPSESDSWCWPRSMSTEQAHGGTHSLKISPHATDGTWASIDFGTFDLTNKEKVVLWVYFDSDNNYDTFALKFDENKFHGITTAVAKTWVEFSVNVADVVSKVTDLTHVSIMFGNVGGTYSDRSPIFVDSFNITTVAA